MDRWETGRLGDRSMNEFDCGFTDQKGREAFQEADSINKGSDFSEYTTDTIMAHKTFLVSLLEKIKCFLFSSPKVMEVLDQFIGLPMKERKWL